MKMTGAQEQKMKCICWELATVDFEIRYDLYNNWNLGECSALSAKNKIFVILLKAISKIKDDFNPNSAIDKNSILQATKDTLIKFHRNSNINSFSSREYQEFIKIFDTIEDKCIYQILDKNQLLFSKCDNCSNHKTCTKQKMLDNMYSHMYAHRNRCAHNLMSYQQNLPSLKSLSSADYIYENYYIRFALLIIIDLIITELYRIFEKEYQASVPQFNG